MNRAYEMVIGLETHVELRTRSKVFCACENTFGAEPNTHVCPVCMGLPGALPVFNAQVLRYAAMAGMALGCHVHHRSRFDRKNYFYPDLPKAYQISQFSTVPCARGERSPSRPARGKSAWASPASTSRRTRASLCMMSSMARR